MIEEYFKNLKLPDWEFVKSLKSGGQANVIEVKNKKDNTIGAFRVLKTKEMEDVKRFYRELEILKKYSHKNIVGILDYTKDDAHQWYISKKGSPFKVYWKNIRNKYKKSPDDLLHEALKIIICLADGLKDLHSKGVVHRDIKFDNLVIIDEEPVLIDFGIAFVLGEERISESNKEIVNLIAIDPASSLQGDVVPWLDVFLLSQLLIKMISKKQEISAQGPRDWRWVMYPAFLESNEIKVKAITALCSNMITSPKDASELKALIENIFFNEPAGTYVSKELMSKVENAKSKISLGKSASLLNFSEAYSLIESRMPLFVSICKDLESSIEKMIIELKNDFKFKNGEDQESIVDFINKFKKESKAKIPPIIYTIFNYKVGEEPNYLAFGFSYILYTKEGCINSPQFKLFENMPIIAFTLSSGSNEKLRNEKTNSYYTTLGRNGVLKLYNGNTLQFIKNTTVQEIIGMTRDSILDPEAWQIVYS